MIWREGNTEKMLVEAKNVCYSDPVKEGKGDTKGLYRMVNTLMGTSSSNPLPSHANNSNLAEDFADFFMGKIENIRENLAENQTYRPTGKMTPSLAEFRSFDQTEVKKIIIDMKTKTCELDALPTKLLKDCLDDILPTITDLMNISLRDGGLCVTFGYLYILLYYYYYIIMLLFDIMFKY